MRRIVILAVAVLAGVLLLLLSPDPTPTGEPPHRSQAPPSAADLPPGPLPDEGEDRDPPVASPVQEADVDCPAPYPGAGRPARAGDVPVRTLRGRLRTEDGGPLAQASVLFENLVHGGTYSWYPGKVLPDGRYEIPDVPVSVLGSSVKILAGARGYLRNTFRFSHAEVERRLLEVVLRRPVRIRGRFVDEDGRPVAGSSIGGWYCPSQSLGATSDAEGRFEFAAPPDWAGPVYVTHRRAPPDTIWLPTGLGAVVDMGDLLVHPGGSISGRVVGLSGEPLNGVDVHLRSWEKIGMSVAGYRTREGGKFRFSNVGRGRYEVVCVENGRFRASAAGLKAGDTGVELKISRAVRIRVRFHDAWTKEPMDLVTAASILRKVGDPEERAARCHYRRAGGSITLYAFSPGKYEIQLGAVFYRGTFLRGVEVGDEDLVLDAYLEPAEDR